ncbi:hypothetical protein AtNW77_Chr3g0183031 [Arabidopsis thaliana]
MALLQFGKKKNVVKLARRSFINKLRSKVRDLEIATSERYFRRHSDESTIWQICKERSFLEFQERFIRSSIDLFILLPVFVSPTCASFCLYFYKIRLMLTKKKIED